MLGPAIKARLCRDNQAAVEYVYARKTFKPENVSFVTLNRAMPSFPAVAGFAEDGAIRGGLHPCFLTFKVDAIEQL